MYSTAFNRTESPIVVDEDGRTIGGGEWGTVDTTAELVKANQAAGWLIVFPELEAVEDTAREAREAIEQTASIRERAEAFGSLETEELEAIARDAGTDPGDRHKRDLVHYLSYRSDLDPQEVSSTLRKAAKAAAKKKEPATATTSSST